MIAVRSRSIQLRERLAAAGESVLATEPRVFIVVFSAVLLTRLPFLGAGYGDIKDAWRVASAARLIATTHDYWASRFPPHPVHEVASAFLWRGGPVALNLATAVVSAAGIALFALVARRVAYSAWAPATAALASVPQVYIASTTTIDYMWALAFMLAAVYATLRERTLLAGVLVGLAIGSRITAGAILLPLSLLVFLTFARSRRMRALVELWAPAAAIGALAFVPVVDRYGADALTFAEIVEYSPSEILRRATLDTWGAIGALGIFACVAFALASRVWRRNTWSPSPYAIVWVSAVVIYLVAFLRLPHLPAYLIPAIPFTLLLLHELVPRPAFLAVCASLVVSPFLGLSRSGLERGAIFLDRDRRTELRDSSRRFVAIGNELRGRNVVVAGHWNAPVTVYVLEYPDESTRYVYGLTATQASRARSRGEALYYLPGARELNLERQGFDLARYGARPLPRDGDGT